MKHNRDLMPVNVDAIRVDAWAMSAEQFGAYFLILCDLWRNGPMKYDDAQIARVARVKLSKWLEMAPHVLRFLILVDGKLTYENGRHIGNPGRQRIPSYVRQEVIERSGFVCAYCGTSDGAFEIDHIVPVSRGGQNDPENLCVACVTCNRAKRDRLVAEWIQ